MTHKVDALLFHRLSFQVPAISTHEMKPCHTISNAQRFCSLIADFSEGLHIDMCLSGHIMI